MTKEKYIKSIRDLHRILRTTGHVSSVNEIHASVFWYAAGIRDALIDSKEIDLDDFREVCMVDVLQLIDDLEAKYAEA